MPERSRASRKRTWGAASVSHSETGERFSAFCDGKSLLFSFISEASEALAGFGAELLSVARALTILVELIEKGAGLGLARIRERVRALGGRFSLDMIQGGGVRVEAAIPGQLRRSAIWPAGTRPER
jgi:hypothetical protein